jgi:hypothetical protein
MSQATAVGPDVRTTPRPASARIAEIPAEASDPRWRVLYQVAGAGALLTATLIPLQVVAFIVWPPPLEGGVAEWFKLFQDSPFIGLITFDLAMMLEQVLLIPIALALFVLLRRGSQSLMLIAIGLWLVSIGLFIAANTGFDMLYLSHGYADATTEAAQATYLAAGQAALASYMGQGTGFVFAYTLSSLAGVLAGFGMLRTHVFSRWAAYAAIAANLLGMGLFVPVVGVPLAIGSVFVLIVWYVLTGWRLLHLGVAVDE